MKKLIILLLLFVSSTCLAAEVTTNYELVIPSEGSGNWGPILSRDIVSIDETLGILSADATGYITLVTEGFAGPLEVGPQTGTVRISVKSVDTTTDGYLPSAFFNVFSQDSVTTTIISADMLSQDALIITNIDNIGIISADFATDRVSQDAAIIANANSITILSDDVTTGQVSQDALIITNANGITILSSDVGLISNTVVIISNDLVWMAAQPDIQFTVADPVNLQTYSGRGDQAVITWTNTSGKTFTVSQITAYSDTDDYAFKLNISASLTDCGLGNQTTMDVVSCDTDGTSVYVSSDAIDITDATVATDQHVIFTHFENTANLVKVNIFGDYD